MNAHALAAVVSTVLVTLPLTAEPPAFKWKEVEIDRIEIGYGLQLTDVNGY